MYSRNSDISFESEGTAQVGQARNRSATTFNQMNVFTNFDAPLP
jgi:hypothetical protein